MTPKEKAEELVGNFWKTQKCDVFKAKEVAKQCALIAVEEIIDLCWEFYGKTWDNTKLSYYQEVKQEIDNITN